MSYIKLLREQNPLVICLTNDVVKNFTANGLLAVGASPAMSSCIEDLEDLLPYAKALLVNIGTVNPELAAFYEKAVALANKLNVPVVLDPVASSAGAFRKQIAMDLLEIHKIALLRGNAGEIAALVNAKLSEINSGDTMKAQAVASKGVDSEGVSNPGQLAEQCAKLFSMPSIVTGPVDGISNGINTVEIAHGSSMMPLVVGTGCLLGGFLGAFIGTVPDSEHDMEDHCYNSAAWGLTAFSIAGEMAEAECKRLYNKVEPGSFQIEFLNALYRIQDSDVSDTLDV